MRLGRAILGCDLGLLLAADALAKLMREFLCAEISCISSQQTLPMTATNHRNQQQQGGKHERTSRSGAHSAGAETPHPNFP